MAYYMTTVHPQDLSIIEQSFFDKKTGGIILLGVLILHAMVAVGLANTTIKAPQATPSIKATPPIELVFLTSMPVEAKPKNNHLEPKPIKNPILPTPAPDLPNPKTKINTQTEKKITPTPTQKTLEQPSEQMNKSVAQEIIQQPKTDQSTTTLNKTAKVDEPADTEYKRTDDEGKGRADTDAKTDHQGSIKKDKEDTEKQQTNNNAPVTFSIGQASWRNKPNFSCSHLNSGEILNATFRYIVDKQGNASVIQTQSTGSAKIDRQLLMQAQSGKFNPFLKNGEPVVGIVNVSVRCQ